MSEQGEKQNDVDQQTRRIADFYNGLRARGVPDNAALILTIDYQRLYWSALFDRDFVSSAHKATE